MRILAVDTSTRFLCLGIYDRGKTYEYNLEVGRKLSLLLAPTIKRIIAAAGISLKDIDYFSCGLGPGSFTGLRVGLATFKALSWSLRKPLLGISTLDILAQGVPPASSIIPVIDARRGMAYCGLYRKKKGVIKRIKPYLLLNQQQFFKMLEPQSVILGDAVTLWKEEIIKDFPGVRILDSGCWYPRAGNMIALAIEKIKEKKFSCLFSAKPIYIYPKECQIRKAL